MASDSTKFKRFGDDDHLPDGPYDASDEFDPLFDRGQTTPGAKRATPQPSAPGSERLKPGVAIPVGKTFGDGSDTELS